MVVVGHYLEVDYRPTPVSAFASALSCPRVAATALSRRRRSSRRRARRGRVCGPSRRVRRGRSRRSRASPSVRSRAVHAHGVFLDVEPQIGEQRKQLLQRQQVLRLSAHDPSAGPVSDDVVGDDGRYPLQVGLLPELGEQLRRPPGREQFLQPGLTFTRYHFLTSRFGSGLDFNELPIVPALSTRVDYLTGKTASSGGLSPTNAAAARVSACPSLRLHRQRACCYGSGGSGATSPSSSSPCAQQSRH